MNLYWENTGKVNLRNRVSIINKIRDVKAGNLQVVKFLLLEIWLKITPCLNKNMS